MRESSPKSGRSKKPKEGQSRRDFLKSSAKIAGGLGIAGLILRGSKKLWEEKPKVDLRDRIPSPYTDAEMHLFYDAHMKKVMEDELAAGKYHISEIRDRYAEIMKIIEEKYGAHFELKMCTTYNKASKDIMAGFYFTPENVPTIDFIILKVMDMYKELEQRNEPNLEERFQTLVVTSFMHELDHLKLGHGLGKDRGYVSSLDELSNNEAEAWAETCRYTFASLVEKYRIPLSGTENEFYNNWVKYGRSASSLEWKNFVREFHKVTR